MQDWRQLLFSTTPNVHHRQLSLPTLLSTLLSTSPLALLKHGSQTDVSCLIHQKIVFAASLQISLIWARLSRRHFRLHFLSIHLLWWRCLAAPPKAVIAPNSTPLAALKHVHSTHLPSQMARFGSALLCHRLHASRHPGQRTSTLPPSAATVLSCLGCRLPFPILIC